MTRKGGGASPDVCPRAPDTLATPLRRYDSGVGQRRLLLIGVSSGSNETWTETVGSDCRFTRLL